MSLTAVATVASGLLGGKSAEKLKPAYGVAFRFRLEIDDIKTGWQSCSGLKVEFAPKSIKTGGSYNTSLYLPGSVTFPKVVLKRAIMPDDAKELQKWLAKKAGDWLKNGTTDSSDTGDWLRKGATGGSEAKITLYDSYGDPVMSWHLHGARPAAWSGPDLDANTSKLALETLELLYEGFEVSIGDSASPSNDSSKAQSPEPLKLTASDGKEVIFHNPPDEITVAKTQRAENLGGGGIQTALNTVTWTLKDLYLTGRDVAKSVRQLQAWTTKQKRGAKNIKSLPVLTLKWGVGLQGIMVQMQAVNVCYSRFLPDGTPIQARIVNLTLDQMVPSGKESNPSSGGIPGRASHMLMAAEDLPSLAHGNYGRPQRWRDIAAANGIDDPLRVQPGTTLYLPADSELTA
jgi:phage tail-like protein